MAERRSNSIPCDTVSTIQVDISKALVHGPVHVINALKAMGYSPALSKDGSVIRFEAGEINVKTGNAEFRGYPIDQSELNKKVAESVFMSQAKRFGWAVKRQGGKLMVQKASF